MIELLLAVVLTATPQEPEVTKLITPQDAVAFAIADLASIEDEEARRFTRYLWIPPWGDAKWIPATNFVVNAAVSHSRTIQYPTLAANGWMLRYDLRFLAPEQEDLQAIVNVWDGLSVDDPYFHIPKALSGVNEAVAAPHLSSDLVTALNALNESSSLVYRADWFTCMALDTAGDGRYYDFRRFREFARRNDKGDRTSSEEAAVLANYGLWEDFSRDLGGERRVGQFFSRVTGKPRAVSFIKGAGGDGWVTEDPDENDETADRHPIYSLLEQRFRGREVIFTLPNGLHGFMITNEQGAILDAVPDVIASDSQIPSPYPKQLQGAISCIRCHAVDDAEGLRDVRNDVATLLASGLQVVGDLSEPDSFAARDKIAGLYGGRDFQRSLERGRFDYVGVIEDELTNGEMTAQELFQQVTTIYGDYRYPLVDLKQAMKEVGYAVDGEGFDAMQALRARLSLEGESLPGVIFDDPTIAGMALGIEVTRRDFERIYNDWALRVIPAKQETNE